MQLTIPCRICGGPLPVEEQTLANAVALGVELAVSHEVCPTDEPAEPAEPVTERRFRVQVTLMELTGDHDDVGPLVHDRDSETEILAGVGHTVTARNFAEAVNGPLTTWLNQTWPKMQESAAFADLPTTSDA